MQPIPLVAMEVSLNGTVFPLLVPDPLWMHRTHQTRQLAGEDAAAPFWSRLWPAAIGLAGFLSAKPDIVAGRAVLELAAGLGLPALVAAGYAREVVVSDYLPEAVAVLEKQVATCRLSNIRVALLDWNALPADIHCDVLLLSDVNYEPSAFAQLYVVLQRFLAAGTTIVLATPQRLMAKPFIDQLLPFVKEQHEADGTGTAICIYVLRK